RRRQPHAGWADPDRPHRARTEWAGHRRRNPEQGGRQGRGVPHLLLLFERSAVGWLGRGARAGWCAPLADRSPTAHRSPGVGTDAGPASGAAGPGDSGGEANAMTRMPPCAGAHRPPELLPGVRPRRLTSMTTLQYRRTLSLSVLSVVALLGTACTTAPTITIHPNQPLPPPTRP